eukprot:scaffold3076_cov117-Isochrysis_galbana.AAC.7
MAMRSDRISASSKKWVVSTTVRPTRIWRRSAQMARRECGSMPDVGSSRNSVRLPPSTAIAKHSLRFCPPDREPAGTSARDSSPTRARASATAEPSSSPVIPRSLPKSRRCCTGVSAGQIVLTCWHTPIDVRMACIWVRIDWPSMVASPADGRTSPAIATEERCDDAARQLQVQTLHSHAARILLAQPVHGHAAATGGFMKGLHHRPAVLQRRDSPRLRMARGGRRRLTSPKGEREAEQGVTRGAELPRHHRVQVPRQCQVEQRVNEEEQQHARERECAVVYVGPMDTLLRALILRHSRGAWAQRGVCGSACGGLSPGQDGGVRGTPAALRFTRAAH